MVFELKVKNGEIYILDTFIVPVDLNKRRNGKKIVRNSMLNSSSILKEQQSAT